MKIHNNERVMNRLDFEIAAPRTDSEKGPDFENEIAYLTIVRAGLIANFYASPAELREIFATDTEEFKPHMEKLTKSMSHYLKD